MNYSQVWSETANFDKANYQYLLRGLLVHLDDPSPDIQGAIFGVLQVGVGSDPLASLMFHYIPASPVPLLDPKYRSACT